MLLKIDELTRDDHSFIREEDLCFYIREFTTGDFSASVVNQLVFNLKCPVNHPNAGRLFYKERAVRQASQDVAAALRDIENTDLVFVPLPPSKAPGGAEYDPRVREMLRQAERESGITVIEALQSRTDRPQAHGSAARPTIEEHEENLEIVSLEWVGRKTVAIFDDVLVTGAQFRAAINKLGPNAPETNFVGIFWARRTFP